MTVGEGPSPVLLLATARRWVGRRLPGADPARWTHVRKFWTPPTHPARNASLIAAGPTRGDTRPPTRSLGGHSAALEVARKRRPQQERDPGQGCTQEAALSLFDGEVRQVQQIRLLHNIRVQHPNADFDFRDSEGFVIPRAAVRSLHRTSA